MYLCVHFRLHLCLDFFSIFSQFGLEWKIPVPTVIKVLVFLINHFHLLNWGRKEKHSNYAFKACLKNTIHYMVSSYRENLHNLPCWLSECQHPATSREYDGGLAVLAGWSGTLLHKRKITSSTALGSISSCIRGNIMLQLPLSSLFEDCKKKKKKRNSNTCITNSIYFI